MPEFTSVPNLENVVLDEFTIKELQDELAEKTALSVVVNTFNDYEAKRRSNQEERWNRTDELLSGWKNPVYWDGTNKPRANFSSRLAFNKVEETLPLIVQSIFTPDGEWFDVYPEPGTTAEQAAQLKSRLSYILYHNKDSSGVTATSEIIEAIKSILVYGNGGVAVEWDDNRNKPIVSFVDIRDIYFDPANRTHSVDNCRSIIRRDMKTIGELKLLAGTPGMKIPTDDQLYTLSHDLSVSSGDQLKDQQSAYYGESSSTAALLDAVNPSERKIEVLYYYSKTQIIVVLARRFVIFSGNNPYGFLPFAFAHYNSVIGRFYSEGIPDLLFGEQKISETIINKHLDELALALDPPIARTSGANWKIGRQKWSPGAQWELSRPKDDIAILAGKPVTTDVTSDLQYFDYIADRKVGKMVPATSGNGVRTGRGVQAQVDGGLSRLYMTVKYIEDYLIIPILCKVQKLMQIHERSEYAMGATQGNPELIQTSAYQGYYSFRMKAASSMLSKEKLLPMLPTVFQTLGAGPLVQGLTQNKQTVNWNEVFRFFKDATGLGESYNFVTPMTQEQMQAMNQPPPQLVAEMEKAKMDRDTRLQMGQMKIQGDLAKEQMSKQPNPMELEMEKIKMQMEQQKMQMDLIMKQKDLEFKQAEAELKLRIKQMEANLKETMAVRESQFESARQEQQFVMDQRNAEMQNQQQEAKTASEMRIMEQREKAMSRKLSLSPSGQKQEKSETKE